jgi:hypothetical protein
MTTQDKNCKNISGGSRNDALPMYIHKKIPKSHETVPLRCFDLTKNKERMPSLNSVQ